METSLNVTYASSLTEMCDVNPSFDKGVLKVAYAGQNRNNSYISKETFCRNIKTAFNCPIVCNYDRDTDTLGGHDVEIVKESSGSIKLVNVTTPVGVVPESAKYWWDEVEEEDGTVREYLFIEVLIWKRQECYQKLKRDGVVSQSMEITVTDGYVNEGVYYITDFVFTAFALIGVTPCFESASLEMFCARDFKQKLEDMMHDLKCGINMVNTSVEVDNIIKDKFSTEGGEEVLDKKMELVSKYGIDIDSLDFSIDDMSVEELEEKFSAMANAQSEAEVKDNAGQEQFELTSNILEEVATQIGSVKIQREWGECCRYWYVDCDIDLGEVYCWDTEDWLLYGFAFTKDGDNVVIDYSSKKRMKYAIVEFDEGEQGSPFMQTFAEMETIIIGKSEVEAKYQAAETEIDSMKKEIEQLRQFKLDAETAKMQEEKDAILSRFSDLSGVEAYDDLCATRDEYDASTLEEKCYAIRGRQSDAVKFSHEEKTPKLRVDVSAVEAEPYGGVVAKYCPVN